MRVIILTMLIFVGAAEAWADGKERQHNAARDGQTLYRGGFTGEFPLQGELVSCSAQPPNSPARIVTRGTYSKLAGVCDDLGARPCAGRFTRLVERCLVEQNTYPISDTASTFYFEAAVRICYDESAEGNCDEVDEVARAKWYSHGTGGFILNNVDDPQPGTFNETGIGYDREVITYSKTFRIDGKRARVPRGVSTGQSAFVFSSECIMQGLCPQTGTLVRQRPD